MSRHQLIYHTNVFATLKKIIDSRLTRPFSGDLLVFGSEVFWSYCGTRTPTDLDLVAKNDTWGDLCDCDIFDLNSSLSGIGASLTTSIFGVRVEVFTCWPHISQKSLWENATRIDTRGLLGSIYNLCLFKYGSVVLKINKDEPLGEDLKHLIDLIHILETHQSLLTVLPANATSVISALAKLNNIEVKWAGV